MEIHLKIVHCPGLYYLAAAAISRSSNVDQKSLDEAEDAKDDISLYYLLDQKLDALCTIEDNQVKNLSMPTSKVLLKTQKSDTYCQNMIMLEGTGAQITVDENRLLGRRTH